MRFFFSGELDSEIADSYRPIRIAMECTLNSALSERSYGDAITEVAIIPMILGPQFCEGRKERRLVKRKEKAADYRLFIDFDAWRSGTPQVQKQLLLENVLVVVDDIGRKMKSDFDSARLRDDIIALQREEANGC